MTNSFFSTYLADIANLITIVVGLITLFVVAHKITLYVFSKVDRKKKHVSGPKVPPESDDKNSLSADLQF